MKRFILVLFGLALVAVCASWFMGILNGVVETMTGVPVGKPETGDVGASSLRARRPRNEVMGGIDLNTILNFANAIIGFVGLMVTYKASRVKSDTSSA